MNVLKKKSCCRQGDNWLIPFLQLADTVTGPAPSDHEILTRAIYFWFDVENEKTGQYLISSLDGDQFDIQYCPWCGMKIECEIIPSE